MLKWWAVTQLFTTCQSGGHDMSRYSFSAQIRNIESNHWKLWHYIQKFILADIMKTEIFPLLKIQLCPWLGHNRQSNFSFGQPEGQRGRCRDIIDSAFGDRLLFIIRPRVSCEILAINSQWNGRQFSVCSGTSFEGMLVLISSWSSGLYCNSGLNGFWLLRTLRVVITMSVATIVKLSQPCFLSPWKETASLSTL